MGGLGRQSSLNTKERLAGVWGRTEYKGKTERPSKEGLGLAHDGAEGGAR